MGTLVDNQGWNDYWAKQNQGGRIYALVAEFYRKVIIRPNLNRFIRKHFETGASLLHAGCGSGQVDEDIRKEYKITGLDISARALQIYAQCNPGSETLHASIFDTKLPDASMDGIYNLGVMEHFTPVELEKILAEFKRVLKPGGKAVFFWPPEYGLSVLFFKTLRPIVKLFTGKEPTFHPDEVCRVQSKRVVSEFLEMNGFKVVEYSFGARDAWTYSIIVVQN